MSARIKTTLKKIGKKVEEEKKENGYVKKKGQVCGNLEVV